MKKMLLVLMALILVSGHALADKIRIGTEGAYPPFNMIDKNGKLAGFDIDIAKALCDKMGADCVFVTQDWDGIIPGLLAGKYDAIIASMSITDERKKAVDFTDRYYSNSLALIARKGSKVDPGNLSGLSIGAQRATIAAEHAQKIKGARVKLYDTQENAYLDLASGRIDVLVTDRLPGYDWLKSPQGKEFQFIGDPIDIGDQIGIAVRKGEDKLRERFNKAIDAIRADGTYDRINAKYFPFSIY
ncbi:MAG TPA: transporter substrate-binding domain-containing protein [Sedimenticola thiotaurini]|uniref:Transporter substrate-binding domain-containing protein n=1 Tax=Sedimenticola thiotaurini TaxID=1543721 RepID=A0A831RL81_9GAMM|nr:transporter substrate-binding domain-containing protein [Sedimenticola thiotaurini]